MKGTQGVVTTSISLTENQREGLAKNLGIGLEFVPAALGVVGVPKTSASMLGLPDPMRAKFSPALIMM